MTDDQLEKQIDEMCNTASFLQDAPLEILDRHEDWHEAFEALGHVYNRWLMRHEAE